MRKTFTTTIEEELQKEFKLACVKNDINMNNVLENFMKRYVLGKLDVEPIKGKEKQK